MHIIIKLLIDTIQNCIKNITILNITVNKNEKSTENNHEAKQR